MVPGNDAGTSMKIIELCGPSGVGKSTVYQEMLKRGGFEPNPRLDLATAERMILRHEPFFEFRGLLCDIFETARGPRKEIRRSFVIRSLAKYLIPGDGVMVIDGGLTQRGQAIDRLQSDVPTEEYFRTMPAPDLIVMFTAPIEEIQDRNKGRGGDHDRSAETVRSVRVCDLAMKAFADRGLNFRIVDAIKLPFLNAQKICRWVDQLACPSEVFANSAAVGLRS